MMKLTFELTVEAENPTDLQMLFVQALLTERWQYGNYGSQSEVVRMCAKHSSFYTRDAEGKLAADDSGEGWTSNLKIVNN